MTEGGERRAMNGPASRTDSRHLNQTGMEEGEGVANHKHWLKDQRDINVMKSLGSGIVVPKIISASKSHSVPKVGVQMDHLIESQDGR